jgi:flagellar hook protein FlgE
MPSAFYTGLSGLSSHSRAVEVVANNLANLNTLSFKGSRSDFRDLFYQNIGQSRSGVASQVGIGAAPITVSRRFDQGVIQSTGGLLDAAVQGEGFFIVSDNNLVQYTRAGNFQLNADQELVTLNGESVQGWIRDRVGGTVDTLQPIGAITMQGNDRIEPTATSELSIAANLQSGSTLEFSRPIQVFDSLGSPHVLTLTFTPVAPTVATNSNAFTVSASLPAGDQTDLGTGNPPLVDPNLITPQPLVIEFDQNGDLDTATSPTSISIDMATNGMAYKNGAGDMLVTWNLLDNLGQPRLTSVASPSAVTDIFQNGSASSELVSIQIADSGKLNGIYSDGRTLLLAQLALARFTNPQALQAVGNNNYVPTTSAGLPITGTANTAGLGSIVGLSLEASNVDIAQEFTNLLTYQRGFQANSRVITTADEMNQEALNLKR